MYLFIRSTGNNSPTVLCHYLYKTTSIDNKQHLHELKIKKPNYIVIKEVIK